MTEYEYYRKRAQLAVLKEVAQLYDGRNIDNIIQNYEAILGNEDKRRKKNGLEPL